MQDLITVYVPGHLDPYDSYGLIGCELVHHLTELNQDVNVICLGDAYHPNQDETIRKISSKPIRFSSGGILLGYPTAFKAFGPLATRSPSIAITMFESTRIPEEWPDILNTLDAVVVPSEFCRESFRESGVTIPIHVVPLGIRSVFQFRERLRDKPFRFLTFLDRGPRKGGFIALQAFVKEFFENDDVHLVLKMKKYEGAKVLEIMNDNIHVIQKDMTKEELRDLYYSCHCLVNPNKGEGFGMIPREFAATGGISLATDWGGTADRLIEWGWSLPYNVVGADWKGHKNLQGKDLGMWAEPDPDSVAAIMRGVVSLSDFYLREAKIKSSNALSLYSWRRFADKVLEIWEDLAYAHSRSNFVVSR